MGALQALDQAGKIAIANGEHTDRGQTTIGMPSSTGEALEARVSFPTARLDRLKAFPRAGEHKRLRQDHVLDLIVQFETNLSHVATKCRLC
jgi:hypothetical protein